MLCEMQKIILREVGFNPCEARLNIEKPRKTQKTGIFKFYEFFWVLWCSVQCEVKKIILVNSSLREVRLTIGKESLYP